MYIETDDAWTSFKLKKVAYNQTPWITWPGWMRILTHIYIYYIRGAMIHKMYDLV